MCQDERRPLLSAKMRIALSAARARLLFCYTHSPGTPGFAHKEEGAERVVQVKSMVALGSWGKVYSLQRHMALKGFCQLVAQVLCVEPPKQGILCPFSPAGAREVQLAAGIANGAPPGMQRESDKQEDCFVGPECRPLPLQYSARFQQRPPGA